MADDLYLYLVNPDIGTYSSTLGNEVVTNKVSLNNIFQAYNVNKFEN